MQRHEQHPVALSGFLAGADLSSSQFHLLRLGDSYTRPDGIHKTLVVCDSAADIPIAVSADKAAIYQPLQATSLHASTVVKVKTGTGGVTAGWVGTNASGQLENKSTDGDFAIGRVCESFDVNDVAEVVCMPCYLRIP